MSGGIKECRRRKTKGNGVSWQDNKVHIKRERVRDETDRSAVMLQRKKRGNETTDLPPLIYIHLYQN